MGPMTLTENQAHVQDSGHPGRPELKMMYDWVRPEILVPVHGEARHLAEQARLALGHGVPKAIVQENGDLVRLAPDGPRKIDEVRVGRLVLDGDVILPADGFTIGGRRRIAVNGLIAVALAVAADGELAGAPPTRPCGGPGGVDRGAFRADATASAPRPHA